MSPVDQATAPANREEARAFCAELTKTVDTLIRILDEEARLVRAAQLDEATGLAEEKSELARRYGVAHGIVKAHGQEIGRLAAVEVDHLRRRHDVLEAATRNNLAVLATARTVSETLIRSVADAVSPDSARPDTYSAEGRAGGKGPAHGPISVNVAL
jgi:hypothetical protein